jgi:DNA polymerase-3 subunit epsilon
MAKSFWLDTETTGVDPTKCAIIQLAGIIEIDGKAVEEIDIRMKPFPGADISHQALEANGITRERMETFESFDKGMRKFVKVLDAYVDPFDKRDKMIIMGYKVGFDSDFLRAAFKRMGGDMAKYGFGSRFVSGCQVDVSSLVGVLIAYHGLKLVNYKLGTVCEHFKIPLDAHDALNDIRATRSLYHKLVEIISGSPKAPAVELVTNVFASKGTPFGDKGSLMLEDTIRDTVRDTISKVESKMQKVSGQGRLF